MTTTRLDEDGIAGAHRVALAIEFHFTLAFEDVIDFGEPLVVMRAGIGRDIDQVQRGDAVWVVEERSPGLAARTRDRRQVLRSRDTESLSFCKWRLSHFTISTLVHLPSEMDCSTASSTATHWAPSWKSAMRVFLPLMAFINS